MPTIWGCAGQSYDSRHSNDDRIRGQEAVRRRATQSTPTLLLLRWRAVVREQGSVCRELEISRLLLHGTGLAQCQP